MIENQIWLNSIIRRALEEDLGSGDLTTDAIIDPEKEGKAVLEAREEMVLAGLPVFCRTFEQLSSGFRFEKHFEDGRVVPSGQKICTISGSVTAILKAERTALNLLRTCLFNISLG